MTQHLFGGLLRISHPAPLGRPGHADSFDFAVQEFAFHVC
jgi:hypothetical protein